MRHILHDWSDEDAITILRNCRKAMNPGGKVLVVEAVIQENNEPSPFKLGGGLEIEPDRAISTRPFSGGGYSWIRKMISGKRFTPLFIHDILISFVAGCCWLAVFLLTTA